MNDGGDISLLTNASLDKIAQEYSQTLARMREDTDKLFSSLSDKVKAEITIMHDALEPVAYRIACGDKRIGIATDLGCYNEYTVDNLRGMDAVLLEANHDVRMLQTGPYPYQLKRRILGDMGHLSNEKSGELLCRLLHDNMKGIFLGHLSKENNLPELAFETVRVEVEMGDNPYHGNDFRIMVAERSSLSPILQF